MHQLKRKATLAMRYYYNYSYKLLYIIHTYKHKRARK